MRPRRDRAALGGPHVAPPERPRHDGAHGVEARAERGEAPQPRPPPLAEALPAAPEHELRRRRVRALSEECAHLRRRDGRLRRLQRAQPRQQAAQGRVLPQVERQPVACVPRVAIRRGEQRRHRLVAQEGRDDALRWPCIRGGSSAIAPLAHHSRRLAHEKDGRARRAQHALQCLREHPRPLSALLAVGRRHGGRARRQQLLQRIWRHGLRRRLPCRDPAGTRRTRLRWRRRVWKGAWERTDRRGPRTVTLGFAAR